MQRRLRLEDFVLGHPSKEIVTAVERADMVKTEPAVIARPVETRPADAGRAEFAGILTARHVAAPTCRVVPAMEFIVLHGCHLATKRVEVKS